jgi:hypothetical protein
VRGQRLFGFVTVFRSPCSVRFARSSPTLSQDLLASKGLDLLAQAARVAAFINIARRHVLGSY